MKLSIVIVSLFLFVSYAYAVDYKITVTTEGSGYVSSYPSGILCGAACAESYTSGTEMTLTAKANEGHSFVSWSGDCSGTSTTCVVKLDAVKSVTAKFSGQSSTSYTLTVYRTGTGYGTVQSYPSGIYLLGSIAPYDSNKFSAGSNVVLTAAPNTGSKFAGWTGDCTGTTNTCTVTMNAVKTVTATFSKESEKTYTLKVEKTGNGSGAVATADKKIDCGSACLQYLVEGTSVTLAAAPAADSVFANWSGACSGTNTCTIKADGDKRVTAKFDKATLAQCIGSTRNGVCNTLCGASQLCNREAPLAEISYCAKGGNSAIHDRCSAACQPEDRPDMLCRRTGIVDCTGDTQCDIIRAGTNNCDSNCRYTASTTTTTPKKQEDQSGDYPLEIKQPGSVGSVKSDDGRIDCGAKCTAGYRNDAEVLLTAIPTKGYEFVGWEGACILEKTAKCKVTIEGSRFAIATTTVRAVFAPGLNTVKVSIVGDGVVNSKSNYGKQDYKINCWAGSFCAGSYKTGENVGLEATPGQDGAFEGWEGDCSGTSPICGLGINADKSVTAKFGGPPPPATLSIFMRGGSAKADVSILEGVKKIDTKKCESNCTLKYKHGTKLELWLTLNNQSYFQGFTGDCMGRFGNCYLTMNGDKTVILDFTGWRYYKLTVAKPSEGEIISVGGEIACGEKCTEVHTWLDYARNAVLRFKGEDGEFLKGCNAVDLLGTDRAAHCVVVMNADKLIQPGLSATAQKRIVKQALSDVFASAEYPMLKSYVENENNRPFQIAFGNFREGKTGRTVEDIKKSINANMGFYLKWGDIQYWKDSWDTKTAKDVLLDVFATEIQQTPLLNGYLLDQGKKPFQHALADLKDKRDGGRFEGLKSWIQKNKNWYLDFTGINSFIESLKPKPKPTPPPIPNIISISPEGGQIGKPAIIKGANFVNVKEVTITYGSGSSDLLDYEVNSTTKIVLPRVSWGMRYDGTITVFTDGGRAWSPIIYPASEPVIYNANGKKEECFGGVGKGCLGLFGMDWSPWGSQAFAAKAGCTEPLSQDGVRYRNCWVAVGSIKHDNCCVRFPSGQYCGGPGTDGKPAEDKNHNGQCVEEWKAATGDVFWGRPWQASFPLAGDVDLTPGGTVNNRYPQGEAKTTLRLCAPRGHELRQREDAGFCCSGKLDNWKKCE